MTFIAVLDYGIGNLRSAQKALEQVGADARLTADPGVVADAAGVVLPGVGDFGRCMEALRTAGLDRVALEAVDGGRPFLGICVGMQMLYGLGRVARRAPASVCSRHGRALLPDGVKRPQMQWNVLDRRQRPSTRSSRLLELDPGLGVLRALLRAGAHRRRRGHLRLRRPGRGRGRAGTSGRPSSTPRSPATAGCALLANFVGAADRSAVPPVER